MIKIWKRNLFQLDRCHGGDLFEFRRLFNNENEKKTSSTMIHPFPSLCFHGRGEHGVVDEWSRPTIWQSRQWQMDSSDGGGFWRRRRLSGNPRRPISAGNGRKKREEGKVQRLGAAGVSAGLIDCALVCVCVCVWAYACVCLSLPFWIF